MDAFELCMTNKTGADEINADTQTGVNAGIVATPTYFIGDEIIVGTKPIKTFKNIINKETGRDGPVVAWFKEVFSNE
jgi:protein-disulfide isomerase